MELKADGVGGEDVVRGSQYGAEYSPIVNIVGMSNRD
jgi:hypothetical protein